MMTAFPAEAKKPLLPKEIYFFLSFSFILWRISSFRSILFIQDQPPMWFVRFLSSSIGKKWIMAISGLLLLVFLFSHIAGNATLYLGSTAFQRYAEQLHGHQLLIGILRVGLFFLFLTHVTIGLVLFYRNRQVRPMPYKITARNTTGFSIPHILARSLSVAAATMPYTGLLTLLFIVLHISGFSINQQEASLSHIVVTMLRNPLYGLIHVVFFMVLSLHIHHGFWSLFQTLGLTSPRFTGCIAGLTVIVPLCFLCIASGIPLLLIFGIIR
jgi:succinate dehydrogenase / fumarate reductase cytochrome b subunit